MPETEIDSKIAEKQMYRLQKGYQSILEFMDNMEQLVQFQDKLDITSNIGEIWEVFLNEVRNLINVDGCALFLIDEDTHEFVLKNVMPEDKGPVCQKELELQIEYGMFSWIINRRQPAVIPSMVFKDNKTIIMLPLSTIKKTLGVVMILSPIEESSITGENLKLLAILARQSSLVIENSLLYEHLREKHEYLKKAQAQILRAEKLASISRLTSGASHEILNPLYIILGHIQLLLMDEDIKPKTSKYLNIMQSQVGRIKDIVKSLSQFSSHSKAKKGEVKINDLIEKVLSPVEYELKFDKIENIKALEPELPVIMGDAESLSQVLFILISNAIDAMPGGGKLKISTRVSQDDKSSDQSDCIEIKVQDTGCGIPEENINRIFDPFFTTKEKDNETGLGLSLSYGIINNHGGAIYVESKVNEGTTFTVYLPVAARYS